jgi:hypothetical protein
MSDATHGRPSAEDPTDHPSLNACCTAATTSAASASRRSSARAPGGDITRPITATGGPTSNNGRDATSGTYVAWSGPPSINTANAVLIQSMTGSTDRKLVVSSTNPSAKRSFAERNTEMSARRNR